MNYSKEQLEKKANDWFLGIPQNGNSLYDLTREEIIKTIVGFASTLQQPSEDKWVRVEERMKYRDIIKRLIDSLQSKSDSFLGTNGENSRRDFRNGIGWAIDSVITLLIKCETCPNNEDLLRNGETFCPTCHDFENWHLTPSPPIEKHGEEPNCDKCVNIGLWNGFIWTPKSRSTNAIPVSIKVHFPTYAIIAQMKMIITNPNQQRNNYKTYSLW